ncbi:hypothetical protein HZA42_05160 [Candidatus Peregrinibacteria bacterium]|nr:hypothetical protein [Candidatus Peregrinibacteria bacterium]
MKNCHPRFKRGSTSGLPRAIHVILSLPKDGVSLMIAIVFVSFFMLVMAGMLEVYMRTINSINNREAKVKVDLLAESAREVAGALLADAAVGANFGSPDQNLSAEDAELVNLLYDMAEQDMKIANCRPAANAASGGQTEPCVSIEVKGRSGDGDKVGLSGPGGGLGGLEYFSAPMKGTGNGSSTCASAAAADLNDADDACNWNRLYVGQSVEVPLYYIDASGQPVKLFAGSNDEFRLRVRTPLCAEFGASGTNCDDGRIILYPDPRPNMQSAPDYGNPSKDPVLIQWTISDLDPSGGGASLLANEAVEGGGKRKPAISGFTPSFDHQNTEISAGRINLAKSGINLGTANPPYDPLDQNVVLNYFNGSDGSQLRGIDLGRTSISIKDFLSKSDVKNPVLRLSLVDQPQIAGCKSTTGTCVQDVNKSALNIPYLEYQLLVKGMPIPDSKDVVTVKVKVGDFKKEITVPIEHKAGLGGFALENL